MPDKLRSISMLVFATAALIGAIAALTFALRSGDARADAGGGSVGRYQLTASFNPVLHYTIWNMVDTTTGFVWEKDDGGDDWGPQKKQLDPAKKR